MRWIEPRRLTRRLAAVGLLVLLQSGATGVQAEEPAGSSVDHAVVGMEEEEFADLRERLTEREDRNRVEDPWTTQLWGYPLTMAGEAELFLGWVDELSFGDPEEESFGRLLLEPNLEVEVFYSRGTPLSVFFQGRFAMEKDLLSETRDSISDIFFERGEMWLISEDILESGFGFEIGRLDFEDDRRWWWDNELDSIRGLYETDNFEIALALAREVAPTRTDLGEIDPEQEDVTRMIAEVSWDWSDAHGLQVFALHQDDNSSRDRIGDVVRSLDEDPSDARLTWLGARAMGAWQLETRGIFGYWLDTAWVWGDERLSIFDDIAPRRSVVEDVARRDVSGWGVDLGVNWILPAAIEPRLYLGYAFTSRDRDPETGTDRTFRQTGIHENESGFGGVQRFNQYGNLLDVELSNLSILTAGTGISILESSSVDLAYHYYRQIEPATFLRDARLDPELNGRNREVGHGLDLVLALEEWDVLEFEILLSTFKSGRAFVVDRGDWNYGGFFSMRLAF